MTKTTSDSRDAYVGVMQQNGYSMNVKLIMGSSIKDAAMLKEGKINYYKSIGYTTYDTSTEGQGSSVDEWQGMSPDYHTLVSISSATDVATPYVLVMSSSYSR